MLCSDASMQLAHVLHMTARRQMHHEVPEFPLHVISRHSSDSTPYVCLTLLLLLLLLLQVVTTSF
jgi:hypothetical protein